MPATLTITPWPDPLLDIAGAGTSPVAQAVADLPIPELVENRRRSIAMLPTGAPALNRDEALELLGQLAEALRQLRNLKRSTDG
jgi:hypothetical protein